MSGKVPLADGGTSGRSVPALAGTLYHLLKPSGREVLLVMGVAGKIDMDVALTQERSFDKRPGAPLVGVPLVMSTVVDGLMPEGNFPSVGTILITQGPFGRGDLKTIQPRFTSLRDRRLSAYKGSICPGRQVWSNHGWRGP